MLCPFDFSEFSIRAYQHARSLAEHYRAKLVALHVVELFQHSYLGFAASAPLYDEACRALRESSRVQLQEFVNRETPKEIQSEVVVELGSAADGTLSFARAHKVDVIVMGTHGRRGYDRLVLGSVTDRVMRTAPCPVLVVRKSAHDSASPWHSPGQPHHLDRILFCADFYKNSQPPLGYALSVNAEYDAELILLHVLENAPSSEKPKAVIAAATEHLETLIPADERKTLKFRTAVRVGKPYREIIHFAQEKQADRHGGDGGWWPWRTGCRSVWFDDLPRHSGWPLPGPGRAQLNSTMDQAVFARLRSAQVLFAISPIHCRSYLLFREQRIRRQQVLPVL
ncbi:MAG TPA: universal stress protein [Terriglobales bacterium]